MSLPSPPTELQLQIISHLSFFDKHSLGLITPTFTISYHQLNRLEENAHLYTKSRHNIQNVSSLATHRAPTHNRQHLGFLDKHILGLASHHHFNSLMPPPTYDELATFEGSLNIIDECGYDKEEYECEWCHPSDHLLPGAWAVCAGCTRLRLRTKFGSRPFRYWPNSTYIFAWNAVHDLYLEKTDIHRRTVVGLGYREKYD